MKWITVLWLALGTAAYAQPGAIDLRGSIGLTSFVDEVAENHLHASGAARFYLTQRFSLEPEFQYLRQSSTHDDIVLIGNVNWDFLVGRVTPYASGGIGFMRSSFGRMPSFSSNEGFVQIGGGMKIYLNDSWFLSPEARVGWEPHFRLSIGIGHTFRR